MEIQLTRGQVAIIDDSDYDLIKPYKWHAHKKKSDKTFYAIAHIYQNGGQKSIKMHRLILGLINPKALVDHINHNGLDNRRNNLRACTNSENAKHRNGANKNSTSSFIGVSKYTCIKKVGEKKYTYSYWQASIKIEGKSKRLGLYKIEEDAAKSYDKAALKYFGVYASFNFKQDMYELQQQELNKLNNF